MVDIYEWPSNIPLALQLRKLEDALLCQICADYSDNPHSLLCGHSYCSQCIRKHLDRNLNKVTFNLCPVCKAVSDVSQLRPNRTLNEATLRFKACRDPLLQLLKQPPDNLEIIEVKDLISSSKHKKSSITVTQLPLKVFHKYSIDKLKKELLTLCAKSEDGTKEDLEKRYHDLVRLNNSQLNATSPLSFTECVTEINRLEKIKQSEAKKMNQTAVKVENLKKGKTSKDTDDQFKALIRTTRKRKRMELKQKDDNNSNDVVTNMNDLQYNSHVCKTERDDLLDMIHIDINNDTTSSSSSSSSSSNSSNSCLGDNMISNLISDKKLDMSVSSEVDIIQPTLHDMKIDMNIDPNIHVCNNHTTTHILSIKDNVNDTNTDVMINPNAHDITVHLLHMPSTCMPLSADVSFSYDLATQFTQLPPSTTIIHNSPKNTVSTKHEKQDYEKENKIVLSNSVSQQTHSMIDMAIDNSTTSNNYENKNQISIIDTTTNKNIDDTSVTKASSSSSSSATTTTTDVTTVDANNNNNNNNIHQILTIDPLHPLHTHPPITILSDWQITWSNTLNCHFYYNFSTRIGQFKIPMELIHVPIEEYKCQDIKTFIENYYTNNNNNNNNQFPHIAVDMNIHIPLQSGLEQYSHSVDNRNTITTTTESVSTTNMNTHIHSTTTHTPTISNMSQSSINQQSDAPTTNTSNDSYINRHHQYVDTVLVKDNDRDDDNDKRSQIHMIMMSSQHMNQDDMDDSILQTHSTGTPLRSMNLAEYTPIQHTQPLYHENILDSANTYNSQIHHSILSQSTCTSASSSAENSLQCPWYSASDTQATLTQHPQHQHHYHGIDRITTTSNTTTTTSTTQPTQTQKPLSPMIDKLDNHDDLNEGITTTTSTYQVFSNQSHVSHTNTSHIESIDTCMDTSQPLKQTSIIASNDYSGIYSHNTIERDHSRNITLIDDEEEEEEEKGENENGVLMRPLSYETVTIEDDDNDIEENSFSNDMEIISTSRTPSAVNSSIQSVYATTTCTPGLKWLCQKCTYSNTSENLICEICGASKYPVDNNSSSSSSQKTSTTGVTPKNIYDTLKASSSSSSSLNNTTANNTMKQNKGKTSTTTTTKTNRKF